VAADKDAAKRRRQARNRQERLAREARVEGAKRSTSRPARTTSGRVSGSSGSDGGSGDRQAASSAGSGGLLGKLFPPRPDTDAAADDRPPSLLRTPSVVVDVDGGPGVAGWLRRALAQPGGRPVLLALLAAVVSAIAVLVLPVAPRLVQEVPARLAVEASTDDDAVREERLEAFDDADGIVESARLLEVVSPPIGVVFALFPLLITGTAVASLTKVTRGRTLLYSTFIGALYVMFTGMIAFFVVGAGLLAFAAYKSRKADVAALAAEGA